MLLLDLIGKKSGPMPFEYTWKDVVLYALGIGAQTEELPFVYENAKGGLRVFPSFGTVMGVALFTDLFENVTVDLSKFIHGEEAIKLYRPIPPSGKVLVEGEITNVYDKGKGALIVWRLKALTEQGEPLLEAEHGVFYVGAGGFGGDAGPKSEPLDPPEGIQPDFIVSYYIPENQAALYRLNGDLNPLHLDPDFAKMGGFPRPILHGLCTYGYAVRAIVHGACDGDPARLKEFRARFAGVVYPGDTLVTEGWNDKDGRYLIRCRTDRGVVLSHAYAKVE
ncbi:MAG: MaoC family dehydratase N-terminal domain-containing protein [Desulfomonile tiedjei]|nr:MaoC family dehydratase N-terminal domain-containing protein [Desulfomonile tiedjei]